MVAKAPSSESSAKRACVTFPCSKDKKETIPVQAHVIWRHAICRYLEAREKAGASAETLAATDARLRHLFDLKTGADGSFSARDGEIHLDHKELGEFVLHRSGQIFHLNPAGPAPENKVVQDVQAVLDSEEAAREEAAAKAPRAIGRIVRKVRKAISSLAALI